ncbi:MAG: AtpZ/AtpI family protein [Candidatus Omnitrophota bacterium]
MTTIPVMMLVAPLIGFGMGHWLDVRFNTRPVLTYWFVILGFVAAAREIVTILKKSAKDDFKTKKP